MTIAEEKQAQRTAGRAARKALDAPQRAAANAVLCRRVLELDAYRTAHTLLLYAAFGGEADLAAVAAEAARQGKTVAYPVCGEGFSLTAAVPGADGWAGGQYGIRTPVLERSALLQPEQLDLVLVPCTAFDADCYRVGMGKGYYDRYLMADKDLTKPTEIEFCTGSFSAVDTAAFKAVGGFDEGYFMYVEDADLTQKMRTRGKAYLVPQYTAIHAWHRAAHRSLKPFLWQLRSLLRYFSKWGFAW